MDNRDELSSGSSGTSHDDGTRGKKNSRESDVLVLQTTRVLHMYVLHRCASIGGSNLPVHPDAVMSERES